MGYMILSGLSALRFALIVMGFTATAFQIIIVRELLVTFHGNELSIGIILGNWLLLEAVGSFCARKKADDTERPVRWFAILQVAVGCSSLVSILFIRSFKYLFHISTGETLGFQYVAIISLIALMPALMDGALFPFGCRNIRSFSKIEETPARVYLYQSIGSFSAGIVFVFYLIQYLNSLELSFIILSLNLCSVIFYLGFLGQLNLIRNTAAVLLMLSVITFLLSVPDWLHGVSSRILWYEHRLVETEDSVYANIAVIEEQDQYTFYANGSPYATIPVPEAQIEELSHFPMLFHERPEEVLIIGGGAGGLIQGVLKHAPKGVHYVEQDPLVIESFRRFPTALTEYELKHEKVKIHFMEGRFFLRNTPGRYDMILLNLPIPSTLQLNRYYSVEFFDAIDMRLKDRGIFSLHLPGSESFLSEELKELNRTIYISLKEVFSHVRVLIGAQNIFIASQDETIRALSEEVIIRRLSTRKISSRLVHEWYIQYKTDMLRFGGLEREITVSQGKTVNQDSFPRGVFESMLYLNSISSPFMVKVLHAMNKIPYLLYLVSLLAVIIVCIVIQKRKRDLLHLDFAIASTGFVSMLISILLIFLFQIYYGYVYHYIGILTSMFMIGSALGAWYFMKRITTKLIFIEIGILALITLVYVFILFKPEGILSQLTIFFVMFIAGLFTGMEYPAVVHMADSVYQARSSSAGRFYALDLSGAFLGAVVTAVVFIATVGIKNTLLLAMIIKSGSLLLVCSGRKSEK